ncbi:phage tail protein [Bacillus mycoides]|uniref:phage tail protein n=1 Tax=Bacillus mycoides TaxID=1405 RepID=UPI001C038894|nr:phage tail protein [Bacillus mycoides]QWH10354.1 phage tail protein [Bacillus mycoides]
MPTTTIDVFDAVEIKNASVLFKGDTVTSPFGCIGKLDAETEIKSIAKLCGGVPKKKKSKPTQVKVKISGHMELKVARKIFGLKNEGLIDGVYSYGIESVGEDFSFVAEEYDTFEDNNRLIAFPNCSAATGFVKSIENGADELAEFEVEITALPDTYGEFYYEGINLPADVQTKWLTKFDPAELRKVTP